MGMCRVAWFYLRSGGPRRDALNAIGLRNDVRPAKGSQIAWRLNFHLVQECDQYVWVVSHHSFIWQ